MRPSRDRLAAALATLADRYRIARELGQGGMARVAWPPCTWRRISSTTAKLMTRVTGAGGEAQLTVVENFFEALMRLVPP